MTGINLNSIIRKDLVELSLDEIKYICKKFEKSMLNYKKLNENDREYNDPRYIDIKKCTNICEKFTRILLLLKDFVLEMTKVVEIDRSQKEMKGDIIRMMMDSHKAFGEKEICENVLSFVDNYLGIRKLAKTVDRKLNKADENVSYYLDDILDAGVGKDKFTYGIVGLFYDKRAEKEIFDEAHVLRAIYIINCLVYFIISKTVHTKCEIKRCIKQIAHCEWMIRHQVNMLIGVSFPPSKEEIKLTRIDECIRKILYDLP